jgi:hypothetical protein
VTKFDGAASTALDESRGRHSPLSRVPRWRTSDELKGSLGGKGQGYDFARTLELLAVTKDETKPNS